MIYGAGALLLNFLAIAVFALAFSVLLLSATKPLLLRLSAMSAITRRRALWLIVLLPWVLSAVSTLLSLVPSYSMGLSHQFEFLFWHHSTDFPVFSWHGFSVAVLLVYLLWRVSPGIKQMQQQSASVSALNAFAERSADRAYWVLPSAESTAFTAGFLKPRCYVSRALLASLSEQERQVVLAHEQAHARHYDPLKKAIFILFSALYPSFVAKQLQAMMSLAMEQQADEQAACNDVEKSELALTLLKVKRLSIAPAIDQTDGRFCYFSGDSLEQRIHYLMQNEHGLVFPLRLFVLAAPLSLLLSSAFTDALHHAIEILLHI